MTTKNRNIPLNMKEEIQVQTEVNLIDKDYRNSIKSDTHSINHVRVSEIMTNNQILKSFSNKEIYKELGQLLNQIKQAGNQQANVNKRITLIEKELEGLMKRETLFYENENIKDRSKGYYEALCEKDNELLKMQYRQAYNQKKLRKYEIQITELEKEIQALQKTVELSNNAILQNQIYKQFIKTLKQDKQTDKKKIIELENQLRKRNGTNIRSPRSSSIQTNKNDQEAVSLSRYFASELERLQKQNELSGQKLNQTIIALYESNNNFFGKNDEILTNYTYKSRYDELKEKYTQLTGVFKSEIEQLQRQNPSIKGLKNVENLLSLTQQDDKEIQLVNITGWVGIGKINKVSLASFTQTQQTSTSKKLLSAFVQSFKTLTQRYPKLLSQVPSQIQLLLSNSQFLQQTIDLQSIHQLKQIITYQPQIIKVQNVYQYNNSKDKALIFNLRVLIKSLIEEIEKLKLKYDLEVSLDEGIVEMLKGQVIEGLDVNSVLKLYRPLPKIIEVEKIIQRPVYINGTLEKAVPICTQRTILAQTLTQKAIEVIREVPVYIQKVVDNPVKQYIQVLMQTQKIVQIPTIREVIAQKVLTNEQIKQLQIQKVVPVYQEKIVEVEKTKQIVVEIPKIIEIEKPIQVPAQKEYIEIEKIVEKPVYIKQVREKIKEVQVINEKVFERDRYIEVQQKVPHVITNRETVYLDREVPRFITNTEEIQVNVTEVIEKIVPYKVIEEKIIEVPVIREKELIREVQKEVIIEQTHFIKGDREEVIKQVQVIVQKPYREEVLITKDKEIEKIVPLYHKSQKPIYIQMQIPYVQNEPKLINNQTCKIVPVREQVIKEVRIQVPVPVIIQKQVIKTETVYVDKIIEKIVQVPRIVQIEKIVEKIVPIPRIIQKIVQVPRIIQKVVTVEVPCLQIVEVIREIPVIRQVEVIKEVIIQRPQIQIVKQIQVAERQKIVEIVIEKQIPKQVQVERRIPVQVIREIPVQVSRDRIVEKIIEIHQVTVKDREVVVPFRYQIPVQLIVEKAVATEKIVQNIVKVPQITQKEIPIKTTITIPEIVEVNIEKAVQKQVVRQVPGPETIIYIEVPKQIQLLREKVIQVQNTIEVPKQVYLYMDKIVHEYHQQLQMVQVPKIVQQPCIVQVSKPQFFMSYKQVPVVVQTNRNVPVRSFVDQIKQVEKQVHHQQEVEVFREKIKQIIKETKQYIEKEVEKELLREVVINETKIQQIEVPSETKVVQTVNKVIDLRENSKFIEKVVERIVMLPQIVEVTRNIHEITEIKSLGIASNINIEEHTKDYLSVSQDLRASLVDLLEKFKQNVNRQPDLKNLIGIIETHLKQIETWINFPKIIEVPKQVEKIVEKQKVVLVPTNDHQRQASLSYLVEKLITELKRLKERNRVELQLDEQIMRLFFKDSKSGVDERKLQEMQSSLKKKYESMGQWTKSYPFMINSFLQDYFTLNSVIEESNNTNKLLKQRNQKLNRQIQSTQAVIIDLNSQNAQLSRHYANVIEILKQKNTNLSSEQIEKLTKYSSSLYQERNSQVIREQSTSHRRSEVMNYRINTQSKQYNDQIPTLISKLSVLESKNSEITSQNRLLEVENERLKSQLKSTLYSNVSSSQVTVTGTNNAKIIEQLRSKLVQESEAKIKRIQQSQNQQIQRLKDTQALEIQRIKAAQERQLERITNQRNSNVTSQANSQNRKLNQELRSVRRDLQTERRSMQAFKKQHEKQIESIKRSYEMNLEKKDISISSIENVKGRIAEQYEKKIRELKQAHERELEKLRVSGKRDQASESKTENKDNKDKEINVLMEKIKRLQIELQTAKKQNEINLVHRSKFGHTVVTGSVFTSGVKQSQINERLSPQYSKVQKIQTYQSAVQHKYVSPNSRIQKQQQVSRRSSQSRISEKPSKYKPQLTLREFMDSKDDDDKQFCMTFIMIKVIEKIQEESKHGLLHSFSPDNIYLSNLNPRNLDGLTIKFGAPIVNKNNKSDGLYLAPEVLAGQKLTQKGVVFNLAVIWDELIHGEIYFKTMKELQNPQNEFKVRDTRLNPILKNTLFEMMNKDSAKRLELFETKRRLSLQKYIASESKK